MYDDGCGIAISDSAGVYVTHDHWETSAKVIPPGVDASLEFVPRSMDTASTGAIMVVGFLRTGRNDRPILTYAMRSSDHGRTWEEIGVRRSGRFQSLSFRGSEFGLIVYEMRQANKRGPSDTFAIYVERVDDRLTVLSTVTFIAPKETDFNCYAGEDAVTCVLTSLGSAGALLSVVAPCLWLNLEEPQPSFYYSRLYRSHSPVEEFELVTTLPENATRTVMRYRPKQAKESVISEVVYTGLRQYATNDDGLSWGSIRYPLTESCSIPSDSLTLWGGVSDAKYGSVITTELRRRCPNEDVGSGTMIFYRFWMNPCQIKAIDSIRFLWPFSGLEGVSSLHRPKLMRYGVDGIVWTDFISAYLSGSTTKTIDTLFLFVLKPTSPTSAPNPHAVEQLVPNIRVAASTIHVRMPIRTQIDRTLRIVDVTGREIRRHDIATENEEIYIGDLPRGMLEFKRYQCTTMSAVWPTKILHGSLPIQNHNACCFLR